MDFRENFVVNNSDNWIFFNENDSGKSGEIELNITTVNIKSFEEATAKGLRTSELLKPEGISSLRLVGRYLLNELVDFFLSL